MWSEKSSSTFLVVVVASIAAHIALLAVLPADAATPVLAKRPPTVITIETPKPPPPPAPKIEEAPVVTETVAARAPTPRAPRPVARPRAAAPKQVAVAAPAPSDAPVDFSGVTLSNQSSSWSAPTGNGEPMTAPIAAAPSAPVRGPAGDRVVAVGDLSRPPKAPNLDTALAANYPEDARRAGTTGKAVVRVRILADGSVGPIRVTSESAPGFGTACKRTLAGSHWQAPLDGHSQPVITDINYTCTFAVAR